MEQGATNAIQLSNFSWVETEQKKGYKIRQLRFSLVMTFGDPELAIGLDGCLARRTKEDILVWSPPLTKINFGRSLRTAWVNEALYERVIEALSSTEYVATIGREGWDESTGKIENQVIVNA